jgi:mannose-6-phosphate isomerase-like protein (cupin superfamily)
MTSDPKRVQFFGLGTKYLVRGEETEGRFAVVEHDLPPLTLGAPTHTHEREDEYSYVLTGRLGVQIGDEVRTAGPGELVTKPRGIPHAFWNPGEEELRFVELISPAGFERYFEELAPLLPPHRPEPDVEALGAVRERYALTMDMASMETLVREHGLRIP